MELWAADTRGELSYHEEALPSPLSLHTDASVSKSHSSTSSNTGGSGQRMVLVRSPSALNGGAEILLSARELEQLGNEEWRTS